MIGSHNYTNNFIKCHISSIYIVNEFSILLKIKNVNDKTKSFTEKNRSKKKKELKRNGSLAHSINKLMCQVKDFFFF